MSKDIPYGLSLLDVSCLKEYLKSDTFLKSGTYIAYTKNLRISFYKPLDTSNYVTVTVYKKGTKKILEWDVIQLGDNENDR